jgi:hypothetical protein
MRAITAVVMPFILGRVYSHYTSGGRKNPGMPYLLVASISVVAQLIWGSLSEKEVTAQVAAAAVEKKEKEAAKQRVAASKTLEDTV